MSLRLLSKGDSKGTCIGMCSTSTPFSVTLLTFPLMLTFLSKKRAGISDGELNLVVCGAKRGGNSKHVHLITCAPFISSIVH